MNFLLWTKGSYQSSNFDTCKCSGENFSNSSCHFPNHNSVFLQILHDSSVSWKITPLYFFRPNVLYFTRKGPIKVQIVETFEWSDHHSSVSWDITPLYFFSSNYIYFQQKEPIKIQIWWNFTRAVKSLKFCFLMGFLCPIK